MASFSDLLAILAQGGQAEEDAINKLALSSEPPEGFGGIGPQPGAAGVPPVQPQPIGGASQSQPTLPATIPQQPVIQDPTGGVTGPGLAGLPGAVNTQSGATTPNAPSPLEEQDALRQQLGAVLGQGVLPQVSFDELPAPGQAPGGGPSLGNTIPAQPFNLAGPDPRQQTQISLARLLNGGA